MLLVGELLLTERVCLVVGLVVRTDWLYLGVFVVVVLVVFLILLGFLIYEFLVECALVFVERTVLVALEFLDVFLTLLRELYLADGLAA